MSIWNFSVSVLMEILEYLCSCSWKGIQMQADCKIMKVYNVKGTHLDDLSEGVPSELALDLDIG